MLILRDNMKYHINDMNLTLPRDPCVPTVHLASQRINKVRLTLDMHILDWNSLIAQSTISLAR